MVKQLGTKKVSIMDVAKEAGVSITTVSRVFNRSGLVSKKTQENVLQVIEKLRYKPDISARLLASKQAGKILGIVSPYFEGLFGSYYFSEIMRWINSVSMKEELDTLFHLSGHFTSMELSTRLVFNPSFVQGVLLIDLDGDESKVKNLKEENLSFVVINHYLENISVHCIGIDNRSAAINAVNYLIEIGHRRIAAITGNLSTQAGIGRLEGYKKSLIDHGFDVRDDYIVGNSFHPDDARKSMEALLNLPQHPTAVFVASDEMAQEAMDVIFKRGLKVPDDISMIGFDDEPLAAKARIPLTTLQQPLFDMGKMAAELILDIIQKPDKTEETKILLPTQLIKRESCKSIG